VLIEHFAQTGVKKWTRRRTILPAPVASLSQFATVFGHMGTAPKYPRELVIIDSLIKRLIVIQPSCKSTFQGVNLLLVPPSVPL
jgi:hypothetical protein